MADTLILVLFAFLFWWVIAYVIWYQIAKFLKGTLKIHIFKPSYIYGETLKATVHLDAKKDIESHIFEAHLIAYRSEHTATQKWRATRHVELFRQTQEIENQAHYIAGTKKDFELEVQIPNIDDFESSFRELVDKKNVINQQFQKYYRGRLSWGKIRWKVRVDMTCTGLDLSASERIRLIWAPSNI